MPSRWQPTDVLAEAVEILAFYTAVIGLGH
jgi:hypothetical protein